VERAALAGVSETAFFARWARRGLPVVLTGCAAGWGERGWDAAALAARCGAAPWTVGLANHPSIATPRHQRSRRRQPTV
jgi:hypothetical protein